jgi:hypothetical protein
MKKQKQNKVNKSKTAQLFIHGRKYLTTQTKQYFAQVMHGVALCVQ